MPSIEMIVRSGLKKRVVPSTVFLSPGNS